MKLLTLFLIVTGLYASPFNRNYATNSHSTRNVNYNEIIQTVTVKYTKPIYRMVNIRKPYQECWNEDISSSNPTGSIIGGVAGGILGHQVGKGRGNTAATIGGAIIGTMVGNNLSNSTRTRQKCITKYQNFTENRLVGYKNYANYKGRTIQKISKYPLTTITIHISW